MPGRRFIFPGNLAGPFGSGQEMRARCLLALALALALFAGAAQPAKGQVGSADEYQIRAAMLLNIARYVQWPAWKLDASHPQFEVCLLGADPIAPYADRFLENQQVNGKPVEVRHLGEAEDASSCHLLYASAQDRRLLARMRVGLLKSAVLTVSEESNAVSPDEIVGLPTVNEHVHIDVNLGLAQRSGLEFSSRLLRLATVTP